MSTRPLGKGHSWWIKRAKWPSETGPVSLLRCAGGRKPWCPCGVSGVTLRATPDLASDPRAPACLTRKLAARGSRTSGLRELTWAACPLLPVSPQCPSSGTPGRFRSMPTHRDDLAQVHQSVKYRRYLAPRTTFILSEVGSSLFSGIDQSSPTWASGEQAGSGASENVFSVKLQLACSIVSLRCAAQGFGTIYLTGWLPLSPVTTSHCARSSQHYDRTPNGTVGFGALS